MKPMNFGDLIEFNYFRTVDSPQVLFKTLTYTIEYGSQTDNYNCKNLTLGRSEHIPSTTQIFSLPNNMKDEFLAVVYTMLKDVQPGEIFTYNDERYVKTVDSESPSKGYCGVVLLDDTKGSGYYLEDRQEKNIKSGRFEEISETERVTCGTCSRRVTKETL